MERLLKLINEYENTRWTVVDDWLTEEEREAWVVADDPPLWKEYDWHLWHCNANKVAYEKATFDYYAFSKKYGFVKWLVEKGLVEFTDNHKYILEAVDEWHEYEVYLQYLALSDNPISDLIKILV